MRSALVWVGFATIVVVPIAASAVSPFLAWRDPIYVVGGFAGVIAMALLLAQPVLVAGYLPGLAGSLGRRGHRWIGGVLVTAILVHVGALWITSPPDVVDALLFVSPTPFAVWGVVAMWAVLVSAVLAVVRRRLRLRTWRRGHTALAAVIVVGSVLHALMIEGTMEPLTKAILCAIVVIATAKAVFDLRAWSSGPRRAP